MLASAWLVRTVDAISAIASERDTQDRNAGNDDHRWSWRSRLLGCLTYSVQLQRIIQHRALDVSARERLRASSEGIGILCECVTITLVDQ